MQGSHFSKSKLRSYSAKPLAWREWATKAIGFPGSEPKSSLLAPINADTLPTPLKNKLLPKSSHLCFYCTNLEFILYSELEQ